MQRTTSVLPEPAQPFPRWFGGAAAAIWAVGVQSAGGPWDKLLAILTPGIGYLAGHALAMIVARTLRWLSDRRLKNIRSTIKELEAERDVARRDGDNDLADMLNNPIREAKEVLAKALRDRLP